MASYLANGLFNPEKRGEIRQCAHGQMPATENLFQNNKQ